jgi:hypothetical protein
MNEDELLQISEKRQDLAYRQLKGEVLSSAEQAELKTLNEQLEANMVPPAPEDPEVTKAKEQAREFLKCKRQPNKNNTS